MRVAMVSMLRALYRDLEPAEKVVLGVVAVLRLAGIGWGLPSSDGWDVDGIAPRDFLPGLVETFTPGHYFTYPPFHLALLTVLTLPVTIVAILRSPSLAPAHLVPAFLGTGTMTLFAVVARFTSFAMSLGVVVVMGRLAEAAFGTRKARVWAMAFAGTEAAATYYAHTTNLDMPMLFWGALAILSFVRALQASDDEAGPRHLRRAAVFAAFSVATKDQGYALFAIAIPLAVAVWLHGDKASRAARAPRLAVAAALSVALVLLLDGVVFNPSGFAARLRFLTGPASQDFAQHAPTWAGRGSALLDTVRFLPNHYPVVAAPIFVIGAVVVLRKRRGTARLVAALPLLVILSFTLAFNCVARRVEERFVMPQMQFLAVYAGVIGAIGPIWERKARYAAGAVLVWALRDAFTIDVNMFRDARYEAESYMRLIGEGESVETYGNNVYLPRFPRGAVVTRVGVTKGKNPMPGITEVADRLGDVATRSPRWIVVPQGFAWRYLQPDHEPDAAGRVLPSAQRAQLRDEDTTRYVRALFAEKAGYRLAKRAHYEGGPLFPPRPLHASLATDVYIFERN